MTQNLLFFNPPPRKKQKTALKFNQDQNLEAPRTFRYLKEELRFFTHALPFKKPEYPPPPDLKYPEPTPVYVGVVPDIVKKLKLPPTVGSPIRAVFKSKTRFELKGFHGNAISRRSVQLNYSTTEIEAMLEEKLQDQSAELREQISEYQKGKVAYIRALKEWEWDMFCLARENMDQVIWPQGAASDAIEAANVETAYIEEEEAPEWLQWKQADWLEAKLGRETA